MTDQCQPNSVHARTPWVAKSGNWEPWSGAIEIEDNKGRCVAWLTSGGGIPSKTNARTIVEAVNSHDALLSRAEQDAKRIAELEDFASWVDTWVSNPVTSYSVYSLGGLFSMTRDKLAAIQRGGA